MEFLSLSESEFCTFGIRFRLRIGVNLLSLARRSSQQDEDTLFQQDCDVGAALAKVKLPEPMQITHVGCDVFRKRSGKLRSSGLRYRVHDNERTLSVDSAHSAL